jgi:transketolase N-terminal domain/subunit
MTDLSEQERGAALRTKIIAADAAERRVLLAKLAAEVRISILHTISGPRMGHIGGDFSVADILTTLFFGVLTLDPADPNWSGRDRFILSKGHCSAALYSVLALRGFFPAEQLKTFMAPLSALNGHPNRRKVAGVEANTGPLGHGLPIGVGCAVASRLAGASWRTFVVLGDGELQEGSNWEAAMAAGHRDLSNLTAIVCSKARARRKPIGWSRLPTSGVPSVGRSSTSTAMITVSSMIRSRPRVRISRAASSPIRPKAKAFPSSRIGWNGTIKCRRWNKSNSPSRSLRRDGCHD